MATERKRLIAAHERERGKAWCKLKGYEYCGISPDGLWWHDEKGSTHITDWKSVNELLATLPSPPLD